MIAVVGVAGREGDDRLVRLAHFVDRFAERGQRGLSAADEAVEVERDRLDLAVVLGLAKDGDQVLQSMFAHIPAANRRQGRERVDVLGLFDHDAVQIQGKHAVADRRWPGRQRRVEQAEEHQHEEEDENVLHADQQFPDRTNKAHECISDIRATA